ncbi:Uncharacterized protein OS=Planctomyces limnophilus (strain ATCC 43296 / DSM 3776 / IFAM 1008 / 290) GN=Plim_2797 PE=4 SV=1 [Gemmata massiliana]|uniref:Uncharacterized protein n=1 Tax=Gemmata massiliana TaxID=1210884 RepID=A0A6P2DJG3_9BACT|nr:hypothetical protein [Gemmata massiliana]VTS01556.1 Uncharacterized protein OS=Planctomyces limnophilus (strain ATCC 43296 / DSM 3776 / IFAM 1008 / 290) GN=Plim_2797 PE=4 SV=1 [Gemmata massiliana]
MRRPPQKKRRGATRARLVQFEETLVGSDYSADELEFMKEVERYQRETGAKFPSYVEILRVARGLGWVRDPSQAMDRDPVISDFVEAPAPLPADWDQPAKRDMRRKENRGTKPRA